MPPVSVRPGSSRFVGHSAINRPPVEYIDGVIDQRRSLVRHKSVKADKGFVQQIDGFVYKLSGINRVWLDLVQFALARPSADADRIQKSIQYANKESY